MWFVFFFKQKTAYEMRISDWSSDVCSSDLTEPAPADGADAVRDALWQKEIAIYEGRSRGDLSYYVANASPAFLAWTSGTKHPFRKDALEAGKIGRASCRESVCQYV